ncbi:MAG: hypothetical protein A2W99_17555 [Bacteroidetes bacterium GWF2_33_16]|nr:MAG: hypothetical protein A2X00_14695 [Bacteroidetes bacterium GWE2_32_14]OFY06843.1 MAG: hypothetical protein A2W99_17555 [Bacteroidetes bacterium GWF2_33_16]
MNLKFVDILNSISLFQLVLFIAFLLNKSKKNISNLLLAFFFFSQFLGISSHFILSQEAFFLEITPHLFYVSTPFTWLWAPLFYLYIKSLFFSDFRFSLKQGIHFLPFIFYFLFFLIFFHFQSVDEKIMIIKEKQLNNYVIVSLANIFITIQIAVYLIVVFVMIYKYKRELKNKQSNINQNQNTWLNIFIYGYLIAYLITTLCRLGLYVLNDFRELFIFVSFFSFFIYFILLFFNAITNPEIFQKIEEKQETKTHSIPKQEAYFLLKQVNDYMIYNEPFLNPELSLKQLASEIKTPERLLSGVINQYKNQNFYDFINSYRIEKAKKLIISENSKKKTIQEILYDSGFNSKSTFNLAFKKCTGITPTEFKKTQK